MPLRPIAAALSLRRAPRLRRVAALASNRANSLRRLLPRLRLSTRLPKLGANCMPLCGAIWNREPRVPYSFCCLFPAKTQDVRMLTRIDAQSRSTPTSCTQSRYECKQTAEKPVQKNFTRSRKHYYLSPRYSTSCERLSKWFVKSIALE